MHGRASYAGYAKGCFNNPDKLQAFRHGRNPLTGLAAVDADILPASRPGAIRTGRETGDIGTMAEKLSGIDRVRLAATELGLAVEIVEMPGSTRTAEDAAAAVQAAIAALPAPVDDYDVLV